ncbi:MAG: hypothetical protein V1733_01100 [bacterium]
MIPRHIIRLILLFLLLGSAGNPLMAKGVSNTLFLTFDIQPIMYLP